MASGQDCCSPCPEVQSINIPGSVGPSGAAGSDGLNAFTYIASPGFIVPAPGDSVDNVPTVNISWAAPGQNVYIQGAGTFSVNSVNGDGTLCSLLYLLGYNGNTHQGDGIPAGNQVSPSGVQILLPSPTGFYAVGDEQALTASTAQLLSSQIVLPDDGSYLLFARVRLDFDGATFLTPATVFLKLRRTNNTPADVTNAVWELNTGAQSNATQTFAVASSPPVAYTGDAGDAIVIQGEISGLPYAGAVNVIEASIVALATGM